MFLTPKDLNGAAGPNGLNGFAGRKRSRVKLVKPRKIAMRPSRVPLRTTSMRGLGQVTNKPAARAALLIQRISQDKIRADAAKKFAGTVMKQASKKASAAGLGIWPLTQISNAIADNVITPIAEMVGSETYAYVPTEKEIANAQQGVDQLKENIAEREQAAASAAASGDPAQVAANPPVPESTKAAAKVGEENVQSMVESREKILDPFGELGKLWNKVKWYAIGFGGLVGVAVVYGVYKRAAGK